MGSVIHNLKLMDRYERKARLLPALLSLSVTIPGVCALMSSILDWVPSLTVGGGLAVATLVGLAYGASAAGRLYEKRLWPRWPYDSPTNRWLHPDDDQCSQQQKLRWYDAIQKLVNLDISRAAVQGDERNIELVINDAVRELRHHFRLTQMSGLLTAHNEDYGFARNLAGLRLFWLPASAISTVLAWITYTVAGAELVWGISSSMAFLGALLLVLILPRYVRQRAERYAESFFGTLTAVYQESQRNLDIGGGT